MANIKGKVKTLAMVKNVVNVKNCTNFGCMEIDGKKAWGLKTASGNEYSVVHYCSDVNDKVSLRYTTPKGLLGHGNCMTCSNSNLLFGVSNGLNGEDIRVHVDKDCPVISISAREQKGIDVFTEQIRKMFFRGEVTFMMKSILRIFVIKPLYRRHFLVYI